MAGIVRYSTDPLVSRDIAGDPASCVFDCGLTQAAGTGGPPDPAGTGGPPDPDKVTEVPPDGVKLPCQPAPSPPNHGIRRRKRGTAGADRPGRTQGGI